MARSRLAACGLALFWTVGALACVRLAVTPPQPLWLLPAVIALCLVIGLAALGHWRKSPVGTLYWDRKQWAFAPSQAGTDASIPLNDVSVHLDFQRVMLVGFRQLTGQRLWFWLENRTIGRETGRESKRLWRSLRRALFALPKDKGTSSRRSQKRVENSSA